METIWAPWRYSYIRGIKDDNCVFCRIINEQNDELNYILIRGKYNIIVLNKYPYSPGHMMVVPILHIDSLKKMTNQASIEFMEYIEYSMDILKKTFNAQGFNLGVNIGKVGGAGIIDHIHMHIVPRWMGDVNFMTTLADTRVISESMKETYNKLKGVIINDKEK